MEAKRSDYLTRRSWMTAATALAAGVETARPAEQTPDPLTWTLNEAAAALAKGTISSEELTKLCLARIGKLDRHLNSFITLDADSALAQARECDRRRKAGRALSRLYGIPIALKDNIDTAGVKTT